MIQSFIVTMPSKLVLFSHQVPAFKRNIEIYKSNFGAINTSEPGSGKTYLSMALALASGYKLVVICPAGTINTWMEDTEKYGIDLIVLSYSVIASKHNKLSHPYLTKNNDEYFATEELTKLIQQKILLVFDESHDVKNPKSNCTKACHAMVKELVKVNNGSRTLLLSATPLDKEIYVESVLKLLGIINCNELYHYELGKRIYFMRGYGYEQVYNYAYQRNKVLAQKLYPVILKSKNILESLFNLYVKIIKFEVGYSMSSPIIDAKNISENHFYKLDPNDAPIMKRGLSELKDAIMYSDDGNFNYNPKGIAKVIKSMMIIELSKVNLFCTLVNKVLTTVPNSKVILYVWYDNTVEELLSKLSHFNPLRCDGKVDKNKRAIYRKLFQEPNLNYRLIIAKPTSFGRSIGLHDIHGGFPRYTFINPNFSFNAITQSAGRTYRVGTKSDARVILTYITDTDENKIIYALSRKSDITRKCLASIVSENDDDPESILESESDSTEIDPKNKLKFVDHWPNVYNN